MTSSADDIYKKPDAPIEKVTATINEHKVNLNLNNHRIVALEGKANFANIKDKATANVEAPDTLLDEIVEIKDEEEIEE